MNIQINITKVNCDNESKEKIKENKNSYTYGELIFSNNSRSFIYKPFEVVEKEDDAWGRLGVLTDDLGGLGIVIKNEDLLTLLGD